MKYDKEILNNLKFYFPGYVKPDTTYEICGEWDVKLTLGDGSIHLYNDYDKTIRQLPKDPMNMTEEQCKRELGFRLRKMLAKKGMKQKELAEKTGISYVLISYYINGERFPTFHKLDKIARVLDCSMDEFRYM